MSNPNDIVIRKAKRSKAWIKVAIDGVSGAGKTYSSLLIARGFGERPLLIDTENGSGELYSHLYDYDYIRLAPPFTPAKYVAAIGAAVKNGNDVIIIDSLTHCWKYILAYKESLDATNPKAGFANWTKAKTLFDECKTALLQCPAHVIACLRAGSEYAESFDRNGNKKFDKVGTKPIAEPDLEFEFTLALRIERSHLATATKDRTERFDIAAPFTPSQATGRILLDWLNEGEGELARPDDWARNVLASEEVQNTLREAEKMGVGVEGRTKEQIDAEAKEIRDQKVREATGYMRSLGLLAETPEQKQGFQAFRDTAKGKDLDPTLVFFEIASRDNTLKTWGQFLAALNAYIDKLPKETPPVEGKKEPPKPSKSATGKASAEEKPSPGNSSQVSEVVSPAVIKERKAKLATDVKGAADSVAVLKRLDGLNLSLDQAVDIVFMDTLNPAKVDFLDKLDELEAGRAK